MNKYQQFSRKKELTEGEIVLTHGVKFLSDENIKPNKCRQSRPFLILKILDNGHILGLNISSINHNLNSQYRIDVNTIPKNNILYQTAYISCTKIDEIEPNKISENGFILNPKADRTIINNLIKMHCVGFEIGSINQIYELYNLYISRKTITLGSVIKVPYCESYLFIYEIKDDYYTCLPLHTNIQENTQDAIHVLKGRSYVNYDEKYYIPKNELLFIEKYGDPNSPLIKQIKNPKEALELSIYYLQKNLK